MFNYFSQLKSSNLDNAFSKNEPIIYIVNGLYK